MIRLRRYSLALPLIFIAVAPRGGLTQARRSITETDLFKFVWAADPQISPNGSQVAFVRVNVNEEKDRYETQIFVVPSDGSAPPRPLTSGHNDRSPRWSPNGREIAFVRTPEPVDGKSKPSQIYLISMEGGEARALTDVSKGASTPVWSPDGRTIAFNSTPDTTSQAKADSAKKSSDTTQKKHVSDVRVITRAQYRWNGGGYTDVTAHSHIWAVPASFTASGGLPTVKQITFGEFDEDEPVWSPDGARLYFTSNRHLEPYYETTGAEVYSVPSTGGAIVKVADIDGQIGSIALSPDGKRIAFTGYPNDKPLRFYNQADLFIVDAAPNSHPVNLTRDYDFDIEGGLTADQHPPRAGAAGGVLWTRDGKSVVVVTTENGRANLKRFSAADGKVDSVTTGDHDVVAYTATPDGSKIVALISTPTNIGDLFIVDAGATRSAPRQITRVNEGLFSTLDLTTPEEFWYKSFDGKRIQGWILKPSHFNASRKYPLIVEIHGGPNAAYGYTFTHEFDWMAAKGYVVLYANPRGSTSYGEEFGNIIQFHYPGDDYKDLMAGVDELVKRGYVDANRMGVTGGSGGGLLTNWTITQTQRFKAAVAQRDIADWYGFWFTADFWLSQPSWFRKAPWEDPQDFAARSPITHVANVTTPTMYVLGDQDYRTPPADGGEMMFRALKYRKIPTVMVRFPRESHELSRSGEPKHRVERLQHIVGWMDQWLQGKKNAAYSTN
ncbi:MAG TPA: S9 family peptidase [Gemmatimonadaceae bacterium]